MSGTGGESRPNTNEDLIGQDRMRGKASSAAPLHPYNPIKSRGKTLTRTQKKRGREKGKAMSHASDKGKTNYIQDSRDLISTRKKTLTENLQSLRANQYGDDQESPNNVDIE